MFVQCIRPQCIDDGLEMVPAHHFVDSLLVQTDSMVSDSIRLKIVSTNPFAPFSTANLHR